MKRKVNLVGQNTLTVSLPAKWVEKNNINKGDEIDLIEEEDNLTISTKPKDKLLTATLKLSNNYWYVNQVIRNLYTSGYDQITIEFDDSKIMIVIQEATDKLIGFEIVEQGKNYCMIKAVSAPLDENFEILMRRVFLQISQLFDKLLTDFSSNSAKDLAEIKIMRNNIYKLIVFCRRTINKKHPYSEQKNSSLSFILQRIGDIPSTLLSCYEYANKKNKLNLKKDTLFALKKTKEQCDLFYETLYSKKLIGIEKMNANRDLLLNKTFIEFLEKSSGADAVILHHCCEMMRTTSSTAGGILRYVIAE